MASPTEQFFDELNRLGHESLLQKVSGTVRFDLTDGDKIDHWFVRIDNGDIKVSREGGDADAVFETSRALFDRLASGSENAQMAYWRGEIASRGADILSILITRLFPAPPGTRGRRLVATREKRAP
jgi:hypothetical protein